MHLAELAADKVYLSGIFILPIRVRGGANSAVRPVAIGRPYNPNPREVDLVEHSLAAKTTEAPSYYIRSEHKLIGT